MHVVRLSKPFSIFHKSISKEPEDEDEKEAEEDREKEGVIVPDGSEVIEQ